MSNERFDYTRKFDGVKYPRWPDNPHSPIDQSMVVCVCGAMWRDHEFSTGACPIKKEAA